MASTTNNKPGNSKWLYHISPDQRRALLTSDRKDFQHALKSIITDIRQTFDKEGFVLVRGLVDEGLLDRLCQQGQEVVEATKAGANVFTSLQFGPIFSFPDPDNGQADGKAFRETALWSAIPAFVARVLLRLDDSKSDDENNNDNNHQRTSSLRLLKDAFLAKGKEQNYCGWHVDDSGFWPTDAQSDGINVWIALDEIPAKFGGGMAVSPKSHHADWRQEAYQCIGSTKIFPPEGLEMGSKLFQEVFGKTCSMNSLNPELNERIESTKEVFDFQKGDCLFCTRWLFHRSMPINEEGLVFYSKKRSDSVAPTLKRYTIRYELGSARTLRGLSLEASSLLHPETAGKSLDAVCESKGQFYPQCWPRPPDSAAQEAEMKLVVDELPKVEGKRAELMAGINDAYAKKQ